LWRLNGKTIALSSTWEGDMLDNHPIRERSVSNPKKQKRLHGE